MSLCKKEIMKMNYNEMISVIGETNRPPGGIKTILNFINSTNINKYHRILEIGTSTGFTAIELTKATNCKITAIDINERSLSVAKKNAEKYGVIDNINFLQADATNLPFENEEFDFIFSGNIISYIPEREKALNEYKRVLKKNGILFASPMYYMSYPSKELIHRVRDSLKMDIKIDSEDYWDSFYKSSGLELYLNRRYRFDFLSDEQITSYISDIFLTNKNYIEENIMDFETESAFKKKYEEYIFLFRDNLSQMAYKELYMRKSDFMFDRELFTSSEIK
ncbi:class I SAM-dependent methyltransferase [Xenorhabdus sp. Sc-CR9]|uniref:class I SAM-dependent methyltransferase n=1 Tax=Xenorhabdus sp. Sc-CR9 TaxID=2584468 RepID=UPI001F239AD1|nr:class I SAM-dependent methyltransferase [Xenorhabdus sp. Sc-CR9]